MEKRLSKYRTTFCDVPMFLFLVCSPAVMIHLENYKNTAKQDNEKCAGNIEIVLFLSENGL